MHQLSAQFIYVEGKEYLSLLLLTGKLQKDGDIKQHAQYMAIMENWPSVTSSL